MEWPKVGGETGALESPITEPLYHLTGYCVSYIIELIYEINRSCI